jgi:hypothetical protein
MNIMDLTHLFSENIKMWKAHVWWTAFERWHLIAWTFQPGELIISITLKNVNEMTSLGISIRRCWTAFKGWHLASLGLSTVRCSNNHLIYNCEWNSSQYIYIMNDYYYVLGIGSIQYNVLFYPLPLLNQISILMICTLKWLNKHTTDFML